MEKGRKPAAVIISLEDFYKRFSEKAGNEKRKEIMKSILKMRRSTKTKTAEEILREFRDS